MGLLIGDDDVKIPALFASMNERFAPSEDYPPKDPPEREDGIREMARLQEKFKIFRPEKGAPTFRECAALLNLSGPMPWSLRQKWYKYLDHLQKCESDDPDKNGSERIVAKLYENLTDVGNPTPVFFEPHNHKNQVLVEEKTAGQAPLFYIPVPYSVIKLPMMARPWPD